MSQIEITGGAKFGVIKVRWPLAKLQVSEEQLELQLGNFGNFIFKPEDVISIEPSKISFYSNGIRIYHKNPYYNNKLIFLSELGSVSILDDIQATGFIATGVQDEKYLLQRKKFGNIAKLKIILYLIALVSIALTITYIFIYNPL